MKLIPISEKLEDNKKFTDDPKCPESIYMSVDFYKKVGFNLPWICYYAQAGDELAGCAAFKGKPLNDWVEIAYSVFPEHQQKGTGTAIAAELIRVSLETDPLVIITAKTLPEENFSARILRKIILSC